MSRLGKINEEAAAKARISNIVAASAAVEIRLDRVSPWRVALFVVAIVGIVSFVMKGMPLPAFSLTVVTGLLGLFGFAAGGPSSDNT